MHPPREVVCIALGALAMGLQSAAVLALGVAGVPTTYETGMATQWLRRLVRHMPGADEWVRPATIFAVGCGAAVAVPGWRVARPYIANVPLVAVSAALFVARVHLQGRPRHMTRRRLSWAPRATHRSHARGCAAPT